MLSGHTDAGCSSSYAPADIFVLLSWSCGLLTTCVRANPDFTSTHLWRVLIGTTALLLDMLSDSTNAKPSLQHGGLVRVRRALRSVGDFLLLLAALVILMNVSRLATSFAT